jgi:hypothetical protein
MASKLGKQKHQTWRANTFIPRQHKQTRPTKHGEPTHLGKRT